jgi:ABC-type antimicrobial peptide transport system permease subunit
MKIFKRTLLEMMAGGFLGFLIWCVAGQGLTSMLFTSIGGSFSCQLDVENALGRFVRMQLYSAIAGALVCAVALAFARRALTKRRNARAAAAGPVPVSPERGGVR